MQLFVAIICIVAALVVGGVVGVFTGIKVRKNTAEKEIGSAEEEAKRIVSEAIKTGEAKKKEAVLEGKDEVQNRERKRNFRKTQGSSATGTPRAAKRRIA